MVQWNRLQGEDYTPDPLTDPNADPSTDPKTDASDPELDSSVTDALDALDSLDSSVASAAGAPPIPSAPGTPPSTGTHLSDTVGGGTSVDDPIAQAAAAKARAEGRANASQARAQQLLAMSRARFDYWLSQLPIAEKDKQELRDRRDEQDATAKRRMQLAEDAATRAQANFERGTMESNLRLTRESMKQPTPLKAPPTAPDNSKLTWDDVSAFLDPNEEDGLTDAWQNGNIGVGMIAPTRLRYLMANFPIASDGSALLTKMRAIWRRSGGSTQRAAPAPRLIAPPQPPRQPRLVQPRGRGGTGVRTADLVGPQDISQV